MSPDFLIFRESLDFIRGFEPFDFYHRTEQQKQKTQQIHGFD